MRPWHELTEFGQEGLLCKTCHTPTPRGLGKTYGKSSKILLDRLFSSSASAISLLYQFQKDSGYLETRSWLEANVRALAECNFECRKEAGIWCAY